MQPIRLFLENIRLALLKRSGTAKNKKSYEAWKSKGYDNGPEVTVIIQSHNKSAQVAHIVRKLRKRRGTEIIVVDDGSAPRHTHALARLLTGANEFLLRANDLYENITYDRTIRMANGRHVALLQDDDDFDGTGWIDRALDLFRAHPGMAILGGRGGMDIRFVENSPQSTCRPTGKAFEFVPAVNRAPMWVERELFCQRVKHIHYGFAPFQFDDYELCLRAWLQGLQVGWYDAGFRSLSAGGMRLYNNHFTRQQYQRNGKLLYDLFHTHIEEINHKVEQANGLAGA